jgi:hypothetical protein
MEEQEDKLVLSHDAENLEFCYDGTVAKASIT